MILRKPLVFTIAVSWFCRDLKIFSWFFHDFRILGLRYIFCYNRCKINKIIGRLHLNIKIWNFWNPKNVVKSGLPCTFWKFWRCLQSRACCCWTLKLWKGVNFSRLIFFYNNCSPNKRILHEIILWSYENQRFFQLCQRPNWLFCNNKG